ncbi:hypothetical protein J6G99_08340 [bacterium]|nr:hypothetical protein [bacterium]
MNLETSSIVSSLFVLVGDIPLTNLPVILLFEIASFKEFNIFCEFSDKAEPVLKRSFIYGHFAYSL